MKCIQNPRNWGVSNPRVLWVQTFKIVVVGVYSNAIMVLKVRLFEIRNSFAKFSFFSYMAEWIAIKFDAQSF